MMSESCLNIHVHSNVFLYFIYHCLCFFVTGFLIYYAFYVIIVISGNLIYQRWLKRKAAMLKLGSSPSKTIH